MKLQIDVSTTIETGPQNMKFFHVTLWETAPGEQLTIPVGGFFTDEGSTLEKLPYLVPGNSYYNVFINGVLQMEGISTYTPGESPSGNLQIYNPPEGEPIYPGTPIILEIVVHQPTSQTIVQT